MLPKSFALAFIFAFLGACPLLAESQSQSWNKKYGDEPVVHRLIEDAVKLNRDWSFEMTSHCVTEIRKKEGKDWGEITIPYDRSFQEVKDLQAFITASNGKKIRLKSIQDISTYSGDPMYSDGRMKVVTMPGVLPGSVMEWEYKIVTRRLLIRDAFWYCFHLTSETPVRKRKFTLTVPKGMPVRFMNGNTDIQPQITKTRDKITYVWRQAFVDPFELEEYMPSSDEVIQQIFVSSIRNWKELRQWYWTLANKNLRISGQMKEVVRNIVSKYATAELRVQAIVDYIRENFRYVSMSFGYNLVEPHPTDEVFSNKYGDCKDLTLVAMAMLREAGISSHPALFASWHDVRARGKPPLPTFFDHVILAIELKGMMVYTDILARGYPLAEVPLYLQAGEVYVVDEKGGYFARIPAAPAEKNGCVIQSKIVLREDGSALIEWTALWDLDTSVIIQDGQRSHSKIQEEGLMEALGEKLAGGGRIIEHKIDKVEEPFGRIKSYIKYEHAQYAQVSADCLTFGMGGYRRDEAYTKKTRIYPLVFEGNGVNEDRNTYFLPEGFEIVHLPQDLKMGSEYLDCSRTYRREGRSIVEHEIMILKTARSPASAYGRLKAFDRKLSQMTREKIVIRKSGLWRVFSPILKWAAASIRPLQPEAVQKT